MGYHTVDDDSVLAYIRANPAAFRAQLRAISLGIDTRAIDWVAGYEWVDRLLACGRGARDIHRWDMVLASTQVTRYAHDLPRSPYHDQGQVAQTVDQFQRRDNP